MYRPSNISCRSKKAINSNGHLFGTPIYDYHWKSQSIFGHLLKSNSQLLYLNFDLNFTFLLFRCRFKRKNQKRTFKIGGCAWTEQTMENDQRNVAKRHRTAVFGLRFEFDGLRLGQQMEKHFGVQSKSGKMLLAFWSSSNLFEFTLANFGYHYFIYHYLD